MITCFFTYNDDFKIKRSFFFFFCCFMFENGCNKYSIHILFAIIFKLQIIDLKTIMDTYRLFITNNTNNFDNTIY